MPVSRTLNLTDLTPAEVAQLFCEFCSDDQALFFDGVAMISNAWPGAGWCKQACAIVGEPGLTDGAKRVIRALSEHLDLAEGE